MRLLIFLLVLLFASSLFEKKLVGWALYINDYIFDFKKLSNDTDYTVKLD